MGEGVRSPPLYRPALPRFIMKSVTNIPENIYKFSENKSLKALREYIDNTYELHYSANKFQALEFIEECGHGEGFCMGNLLKYAQRYGRKGGKNKDDLMKILHYGIIMLHIHEESEDEVK